MKYSEQKYPLQKESYEIIGICMDVHRTLGKGLLEIVYKDAIEYKFNRKKFIMSVKKNMKLNIKEQFSPTIFLPTLLSSTILFLK